MDDVGLRLAQHARGRRSVVRPRARARACRSSCRVLSTVGIAAMLWVGGHILLVGFDEIGLHRAVRRGPPRRGGGRPRARPVRRHRRLADEHRRLGDPRRRRRRDPRCAPPPPRIAQATLSDHWAGEARRRRSRSSHRDLAHPKLVQTIGWWNRPPSTSSACGPLRPRFTMRLLGQPPSVILSDPEDSARALRRPARRPASRRGRASAGADRRAQLGHPPGRGRRTWSSAS